MFWCVAIACLVGVCQDAGDWAFGVQDNCKWDFTVRQQPAVDVPGVVPPAKGQDGLPAAPHEYYVVMYSATWCGPCQNWKRQELPKLRAAGISVTVVDCDKEPQWRRARRATDSVTGKTVVIPGVSSYPTFAVVRTRDRFPVAQFVGPVSAHELQKRIPKAAPEKAAPLSFRWNIEGDWSPTQEQTAKHLTHRHNIDVANMSHQQMLAVHDALHDAAD